MLPVSVHETSKDLVGPKEEKGSFGSKEESNSLQDGLCFRTSGRQSTVIKGARLPLRNSSELAQFVSTGNDDGCHTQYSEVVFQESSVAPQCAEADNLGIHKYQCIHSLQKSVSLTSIEGDEEKDVSVLCAVQASGEVLNIEYHKDSYESELDLCTKNELQNCGTVVTKHDSSSEKVDALFAASRETADFPVVRPNPFPPYLTRHCIGVGKRTIETPLNCCVCSEGLRYKCSDSLAKATFASKGCKAFQWVISLNPCIRRSRQASMSVLEHVKHAIRFVWDAIT
uniref:Uncharacterized protein n=1 Tax=Rhipicephalus zambeziensis TaxID=60191 RepID=A0A224YH43_9ACAR